MKTETITTAPTQDQVLNATLAIEKYFTLQTRKAELDEEMKKLKSELNNFAITHRDSFVEGAFNFDCCGYLRFGERTEVKLNRSKFNLLRVVKAFPEFLKKEFSISAIKAAFAEPKHEKKAKELGISLNKVEVFEIVRKDKAGDLPIKKQ